MNLEIRNRILLVIGGILVTLIFIEIGLRTAGALLANSSLPTKSSKGNGMVRVLCLGESTTMLGGYFSYPSQMERILNQHGKGHFEVINKGIPGTDTSVIVSQLDENLRIYNPDFVVTMMGINDHQVTPVEGMRKANQLKRFFQKLRIVKLAHLISFHLGDRFSDLWEQLTQKYNFQVGSEEYLIEKKLKNEISLRPKEEWPYRELSEFYEANQLVQPAEKILRRGLARNPRKSWAYDAIGQLLIRQKKSDQAESIYKQAIPQNPKKSWPKSLLAKFYQESGRFQEGERILLESIKEHPADSEAYFDLILFFLANNRYSEAQRVIDEAVHLRLDSRKILMQQGFLYGRQNQFQHMEEVFDNLAEREHDPRILLELVDWYIEKNALKEAEKVLRKGIALAPQDERFILKINNLFSPKLFSAQSTVGSKLFQYSPEVPAATVANYTRLAKILKVKNIQLISMQYPRQDITPLQTILGTDTGIIFVENKSNFETALKAMPFNRIFSDSFAGDFGHCTPEGNRLIAENLAQTIFQNIKK